MPYYSPTATALHRKSPPTCTLSLAHVSASKFRSQAKSSFTVKNAGLNLDTMQVELQVDFSSVITVPVQVQASESNSSVRRSKSRKRVHTKRNDINVIPFPKSVSPPLSPVSDSSSSSLLYSSDGSNYSSTSNGSSSPPAPHVLLRSTNAGPPSHTKPAAAAQRARKGNVKASGLISLRSSHSLSAKISSTSPSRLSSSIQPPSSSRSPSADHIPLRPSSPTPHSPTQVPLQNKKQLLKNDECFDPPPYSLPPPPYSASPDLQVSSEPKATRPLPAPAPLASSPPKSSRIPIVMPSPLPHSQTRRPRVSGSELKTLLYLYRTIMCGVERRHRLDSSQKQPSSEVSTPSTSPGRSSGNHFARFPLVEEDEDDDDQLIFTGPQRAARRLSKSPAEHAANFDVQDTVLAIKLRLFLKEQGVTEDELAIQLDAEEDEVILVESNMASASPADASVPVDAAAAVPPIFASPSPLPMLVVGAGDRPIRSSPPPLSPVPQTKPFGIPSASYMIALLKMRNKQFPARKRFGVVNDSSSSSKGMSGRGRRSGLNVCSWVADSEVDENGAGLTVVKEVEEEFDCDSLVDWYNY